MSEADNTDWKALALELAQRVNFSLQNLKPQQTGGGFMLNLDTGEVQHWHDYMVEPMRKIPGFKIDAAVFPLLRLPKVQRTKQLKELEFERKHGIERVR